VQTFFVAGKGVVVGDEVVPKLAGVEQVQDRQHQHGLVRRLALGARIPAAVAVAAHFFQGEGLAHGA
jgi:hypothetical protein